MYINSDVQYAIELQRNGDRFENHFNRFRNEDEVKPNAKTAEEKSIARYSKIQMKEKALVDFYKCTEQFDEKAYQLKLVEKCAQLPSYLKNFYYLVVFHNNFNNLSIFHNPPESFKDFFFPYHHKYDQKPLKQFTNQQESPRKRPRLQVSTSLPN